MSEKPETWEEIYKRSSPQEIEKLTYREAKELLNRSLDFHTRNPSPQDLLMGDLLMAKAFCGLSWSPKLCERLSRYALRKYSEHAEAMGDSNE